MGDWLDVYGDCFSDGIEAIWRVLKVIGWFLMGLVVLPFMLAMFVLQSPFAILGWVCRRFGFETRWR